jgi:hypothetical protein
MDLTTPMQRLWVVRLERGHRVGNLVSTIVLTLTHGINAPDVQTIDA